jgi:hypothetical protein
MGQKFYRFWWPVCANSHTGTSRAHPARCAFGSQPQIENTRPEPVPCRQSQSLGLIGHYAATCTALAPQTQCPVVLFSFVKALLGALPRLKMCSIARFCSRRLLTLAPPPPHPGGWGSVLGGSWCTGPRISSVRWCFFNRLKEVPPSRDAKSENGVAGAW